MEWNPVDGFAKPFVAQLKDNRIDGMEKRALDKVADAHAERGNVIDGEVLERIPAIPQAVVEPLKRIVVEGGFNRQEPEEPEMSTQELRLMIAKLNADKQ